MPRSQYQRELLTIEVPETVPEHLRWAWRRGKAALDATNRANRAPVESLEQLQLGYTPTAAHSPPAGSSESKLIDQWVVRYPPSQDAKKGNEARSLMATIRGGADGFQTFDEVAARQRGTTTLEMPHGVGESTGHGTEPDGKTDAVHDTEPDEHADAVRDTEPDEHADAVRDTGPDEHTGHEPDRLQDKIADGYIKDPSGRGESLRREFERLPGVPASTSQVERVRAPMQWLQPINGLSSEPAPGSVLVVRNPNKDPEPGGEWIAGIQMKRVRLRVGETYVGDVAGPMHRDTTSESNPPFTIELASTTRIDTIEENGIQRILVKAGFKEMLIRDTSFEVGPCQTSLSLSHRILVHATTTLHDTCCTLATRTTLPPLSSIQFYNQFYSVRQPTRCVAAVFAVLCTGEASAADFVGAYVLERPLRVESVRDRQEATQARLLHDGDGGYGDRSPRVSLGDDPRPPLL